MYMVLADVKNRLGNREEAMGVLRQGLEAARGTGDYAGILFKLTNVYATNGQFSEAEQGVKELREIRLPPLNTPFPPARLEFLDASLALMKGDWKTAMPILVDILPKLHDDPDSQKMAYIYLGQCCQQQNDFERQIVAYSEAVKIDPYLVPARRGLAEIYAGRGNLAAAAEQYGMLLKGPRADAETSLSLARIWIMMRRREDPEKRDWEPVDKLLDRIEQQTKLTPDLAVLKSEVLLAKDRPEEARTLLEQGVAKFPENTQLWLALINMAKYQAGKETDPTEKEKRWKQASDYTDRAEKSLGDQVVLRTVRGSCAVLRKDPQAIELLQRLGQNVTKMKDAEKARLWNALATLAVEANDLSLARFYYRLVAEQEPKNIPIRLLLCDLDLRVFEKGRTPDLQELDKRLDEIEQLDGRGPFWLYGKAVRTLLQSNNQAPQLLSEARSYLQSALELRKDWSAPTVLTGKICELQNEPDQALEFYIRAIYRMGERDNDVIRRTVQLLLPRGRMEEARQLFDYLEKLPSPLLDQMNQEYTYLQVFTGGIAEAEKEVENSVAANSKNYQDYFRQGQMYGHLAARLKSQAQSADRNPKPGPEMIRMAQRAVNALLTACRLNPQADEVWIALVQLLVDVGQPDKARPLIAAGEASLKGDQAPITLAICCELLNETEKAQAKYEAAVKAAPQNSRVLRRAAAFYLKSGKLDAAETLLKQIVALQTPATLTDACWARRNLAVILKGRGDFAHLCQGMELIEENLHSKAASTDDKRMKVLLLRLDPRKEKMDEAIRVSEDLVQSADAASDDYFELAKLYLKKGDWTSYEDRMHSALGAQKGVMQLGCVIFYIQSLLERKQLADIDKWLQILERNEKDGGAANLFDTVRLRAEYEYLRGDYKAAGNLAMAFLDNPNAHPQDRGQQLLLVAKTMETFGNWARAEGKPDLAGGFTERADTLFASLRSKRVSATGDLLFAAYLARQKRIRECLDVLEQCGDQCPPDDLAQAAVLVIRTRAASDAQYGQLEKILVAAANKANHPVPLSLALGELHARQGQYEKSIADYREALAKEPRCYPAMNDLGVGLAWSGQAPDEALRLINDALAICGPLAEVLDSRAMVYLARHEPEKALEDLAAAIRDDGAAEHYFHQAQAYLLAGRKAEASAAFAAAMKKGLAPENLDPREVPDYKRLKAEL